MGSPEFRRARDQVIDEAGRERTAIMCAEAVPWRCHRNLIADAVVAAGAPVEHILDAGQPTAHELNPAARIDATGRLSYPAPESDQGQLPF